MNQFSILYQDDHIIAIDKPSGFHVHPPESKPEKVPRHKIVLHQLRDQIGQKIYPLHRLDAATSGVLLFALNSEVASFYGKLFQSRGIEKTYWAVVRGFVPDEGEISLELELDSTGELVPAKTLFRTLRRMELDEVVGNRNLKARYSWLEVSPQTGRFHQIRRHMNRISHPVVGDSTHGDSKHNQFFREKLEISGLCLRAVQVRLPMPSRADEVLAIDARESWKWKKIERLFDANSFKKPE
ncbi:MAG: pseudouridine synthase [Pseudobdellovibrionaceae bacterium]